MKHAAYAVKTRTSSLMHKLSSDNCPATERSQVLGVHAVGAVERLLESFAGLDEVRYFPVVNVGVRHSAASHQLPHQHAERPLAHATRHVKVSRTVLVSK